MASCIIKITRAPPSLCPSPGGGVVVQQLTSSMSGSNATVLCSASATSEATPIPIDKDRTSAAGLFHLHRQHSCSCNLCRQHSLRFLPFPTSTVPSTSTATSTSTLRCATRATWLSSVFDAEASVYITVFSIDPLESTAPTQAVIVFTSGSSTSSMPTVVPVFHVPGAPANVFTFTTSTNPNGLTPIVVTPGCSTPVTFTVMSVSGTTIG